MGISFRKGGKSRESSIPTESSLASQLDPKGHIQSASKELRERFRSMSQAELKEFFHQEWDDLSELMYEMGEVKWASLHHGEEIRQLNSKTLLLYQSYQMMDDVVRDEVAQELVWTYTPLPVGRVSYLEWILFCVREAGLEHYP
jgi:hypothetical protein